MNTRRQLGSLARLIVRTAGARPAPAAGTRRRRARRAVWLGALCFALATLALAVAAETVKPEWRDPEYGHRLRALRAWQAQRPTRPLVLVVGSSRTQMGVSPGDMGFADEPGSPVVYNCGYRGGFPYHFAFQVERFLDDGVRPAAVVVMLSATESKMGGWADQAYPDLGSRLNRADLRRWEPYTLDPAVHRNGMLAARRNPWQSRREALVSDLLPEWQTKYQKLLHEGWEQMDAYGFSPFPEHELPPPTHPILWAATAKGHPAVLNTHPLGAVSVRALRDLAERCRAAGVAVAMVWAPESPRYRALYTASGRAAVAELTRTIAEWGVPVFPPPEHLNEDDFVDGYHMRPSGATRYSRWLADAHLRPWLAEVVK